MLHHQKNKKLDKNDQQVELLPESFFAFVLHYFASVSPFPLSARLIECTRDANYIVAPSVLFVVTIHV